MSLTTVLAFPVSGTGQGVPLYFTDTSGNPVTGWTGAAAQVSQDDGNAAATTNAPVESGPAGFGYINLTDAECTGGLISIQATLDNLNSIPCNRQLVTGGLDQIASVVPDPSAIVTDIFDFTLPAWDPSQTTMPSFGQLMGWMRALTYFASSQAGNIGYITDVDGNPVASFNISYPGPNATRSKPVEL